MNYQDRVKQYDALFGANPNSAAARFWQAWKPQYLKGFEKMGGGLGSSAPDPAQIDLTQFSRVGEDFKPLPTLDQKDMDNFEVSRGFANDPVLQHFANPQPTFGNIFGYGFGGAMGMDVTGQGAFGDLGSFGMGYGDKY